MQLNFKQLASLPIFNGIWEEDLPAMLNCLGSFQKNYQKDEIMQVRTSSSWLAELAYRLFEEWWITFSIIRNSGGI